MLYLYDHAICQDIHDSFTDEFQNSAVKVIDPENAVNIVSQIQNDEIKFPCIILTRPESYSIDESRMNFTRAKFGVPAVFDEKENNIYYEKALPINIDYSLTILTTNTADRDECTKELLFKYTSVYFLTIELPYEAKRKIRFGISIPPGTDIDNSSGQTQYVQSGALYQAIIPLHTEGMVYVSYTPQRVKRFETDVEFDLSGKINQYGVVPKKGQVSIPRRPMR